MSSKLPKEIWINIFLQLHQADQMECMLVCQHWNQVIERFTLYQTAFIYSVASMARLIEKIQQRPKIANQIEKLMTHDSFSFGVQEKVNYLRLLSSLTNLKELYSSITGYSGDIDSRYPECKKIKYLADLSYDLLTCRALLSNTCLNLTTLRIVFPTSDIFSIFKNTPALTILIMDACEIISFNHFEVMHQNLPRLKSLRLYSIKKLGSFEFDKRNAAPPANSVTDCRFSFGCEFSIFNTMIRFLEYFAIKYPNLTKLEFRADRLPLDPENMQIMKDRGWTPLFRKLGSQLKDLYLVAEDCYEHLFGLFDRSSCTLRSICLQWLTRTLLEEIASSQQALHIQTLVLRFPECGSFHWLKNLQVLTKLKLHSFSYYKSVREIQLNDIIANAPSTLNSLSLKSLAFAFDPDYTGTSNIKILSLTHTYISDKACDFFANCFPRLLTLKIKHCELKENILSLTKTDLRVLHYGTCRSSLGSYIGISIVTQGNNEQRLYRLNNHPNEVIRSSLIVPFLPQDYFPFKSYSLKKGDNLDFHLIFTCHSLGRVVLKS